MQLIATTSNQTMSSLDLLDMINGRRVEFGEKEVRRNDFHARVADELSGEHYETFVVSNTNGTESEAYALTIKQCMYVAMRESKGVRRKVQEALEEKHSPTITTPQSFAQALRLAAEQAELIEQQQAALAIAAPKAAFVDNYVDATGLKNFRDVAKLLKVKEPSLRLFLVEKKVMYRLNGDWAAYQNHIDAGRFAVKTGEANGHAFNRSMFTPKGVEWVAGEFAKFQLAQNDEVPA